MIPHVFTLDGRQVKVISRFQSTPLLEFDKRFLEQYVSKNIEAVRESWLKNHWCSKCGTAGANIAKAKERCFWLAVADGKVFVV